MKKKEGPQLTSQTHVPPTVFVFTCQHIRNDLLAKVELVRKQKLKSGTLHPRIFYNKRLSKSAQEIFYQTRLLVKKEAILSTWIFKGEVYIKKENTASPCRILSINDLKEYL